MYGGMVWLKESTQQGSIGEHTMTKIEKGSTVEKMVFWGD